MDAEQLKADVLVQLHTIKDRCQRHGFFGREATYLDMRDVEQMVDKCMETMLKLIDSDGVGGKAE